MVNYGTTSLDGNARSSSAFCCETVKWIPVVILFCIILWSYYAFVIQLCLTVLDYKEQQLTYLVVYHLLYGMLLWTYLRTIFTKRARVPDKFKLSQEDLQKLAFVEKEAKNEILKVFAAGLPVVTRASDGTTRFCDRCKIIKPDRAHHCSVCMECVLKMDHHCPWINNCVCFSNYKFFLLFLGYTFVYCVGLAAVTVPYCVTFWKAERTGSFGVLDTWGKFHILFLFFVALMFGISVGCLFFYHLNLVASNRTTLEAFRSPVFQIGPDKDGFNLRCRENYKEVFGERPVFWFLPIFSTRGDGVTYPTHKQIYIA